MRLILDRLSGARGGRTLFSPISLTLRSGDALVVTGPNGSGKSTLLRIIAGLLAPASGEARLEDAASAFPDLASACHFLGDGNALKSGQTVRQNLAFWAEFQGRPGRSIQDALELIELPTIADLPAEALSKGMRRRVAIARLLVADLPVWLMDEPTSGLDSASVERVEKLIEEHRANGGIVVVASHHNLHIEGALSLDLYHRESEAVSSQDGSS
ncbi:heme ABC exporter ATP-binding protein CcmA [Notoacmeibacter sp. MSK16QG-6]|uniref:heme ABC exporter ATP-binding protein CcmA n=1 Tax=Notoacmeibacter sp. MSK16QG-6 TaxID=2957982 RepID=UPI0020A0221B|nr:heme ABC exporter ATP-binding protein CcmA [Notoacmeibacter sp. MSK16QG-6]MCP1199170.1 heme ABC exporter ATP-binding protein CcmA [Notoacmeibacter sp. MSK16QG-6]